MKISTFHFIFLFLVVHIGAATAAEQGAPNNHYPIPFEALTLDDAEQFSRQGLTLLAREAFNRLRKDNPNSHPAHRGYQKTSLSLGMRNEILQEYGKKLEANPTSALYNYLLAVLLENDRTRNQVLLNSALEQNPDFVPAKISIANSLRLQKKFTAALAILENVIVADPSNMAATTEFGYILLKAGKIEEGLVKLNEAASGTKPNIRAICIIAQYHYGRGDLSEGDAYITKAIRYNRYHPLPYRIRGDSRIRNGDVNIGFLDYQHAIQLNPTDANLYNNLAWYMLIAQNEVGSALSIARIAVLLSEERDPQILDTLASALYIKRDFDEAEEAAQKATVLAPKSVFHIKTLEKIRSRTLSIK